MIASLPMYDWPETRVELDKFWQRLAPAIQQIYVNEPEQKTVPTQLDRSDEHSQWQRDDVLLSQTCGYPLITSLPESTVVVGTPDYQCEFSHQGHYASPILVRQSDRRIALPEFSASKLAFNSTQSQSGFNALKSLLIEKNLIGDSNAFFFAQSVCTGSHRDSLSAVASGLADLCAIDPVSWALAQRFDKHADQLRVLTTTSFAPALPLISSKSVIPKQLDEHQWRSAVIDAYSNAIDSDAEQHLLLDGITYVSVHQYKALPVSNMDMFA